MTRPMTAALSFTWTLAALAVLPAVAHAQSAKTEEATLEVCVDLEADVVRSAAGGCETFEQKTAVALAPLGDAVAALQAGHGVSLSDLTKSGQWVSPKFACAAGEVAVETPTGAVCLPADAPLGHVAPGSIWLLTRFARGRSAVAGNDRESFTWLHVMNPGDAPATGVCLYLGSAGEVLHRGHLVVSPMGTESCAPLGVSPGRVTTALVVTDRPVFAQPSRC
jgi:hypothetical protein